jgi:hypothetical protein
MAEATMRLQIPIALRSWIARRAGQLVGATRVTMTFEI